VTTGARAPEAPARTEAQAPTPTDSHDRRFRGDIQVLRAVAVLLVVASHVTGVPDGGFIGVDVFFVISGFLITRMLLDSAGRPWREVVTHFYARRARRILPAALTTLAVTTVVSWLILSSGRADRVATDAVWAALFGANWHFAAVGTDYFASSTPPSPLQHYWSLAVEEQFYLVWPLLLALVLVAVRTRGRGTPTRVALGLAGLIAVASFGWACWQSADAPTVAYYSTLTRAWEIAVGAVVACLATSFARLPHRLREGLVLGSLAAILGSAFVIGARTTFPGPGAALPVLAAAVFLSAGTGLRRPLVTHRVLASRAVLHLGVLSYAIYLWHWPALVLAEATLDVPGWQRGTAVLVVTLALAELTYRFVERPFLAGSGTVRVPRWRWATVAVAAAVVVAAALPGPGAGSGVTSDRSLPVLAAPVGSSDAAGAMIGVLQGQLAEALATTDFPDLVPSIDAPLDGVSPEMTDFDARCLNPPDPTDTTACTFEALNPNGRTVVLLGDSIATSWLPGIREALGPEGYAVHAVTFSSCPPALVGFALDPEPWQEECEDGRAAALDQLEELEPDLVIGSVHQDAFGGVLVPPRQPDIHSTYVQGLLDVGARVEAAGARFVLLGPPPHGPNPLGCGGPLQHPADCLTSTLGSFDATTYVFSDAALQGGFGFINTTPWFCVDTRCPIFAGGRLIRFDDAHLTRQFATYLAPLLREVLNLELLAAQEDRDRE
jgi:peptidoglycan/LPS O-acetylase OafA/YrhL